MRTLIIAPVAPKVSLPSLAVRRSKLSPAARSVSLLLAALLMVGAACGGDDDKGESANDDKPTGEGTAPATTVPEGTSWIAQVKGDIAEVAVYPDTTSPEGGQTLANPNEVGAPLTFLVDSDTNPSGEERIPVFLPIQPNGSKGFINASDVEVAQNPYRIKVELGAHKLTLTKATDKGPETIVDTEVGVGQTGRDTPKGVYFIKELLQAPDPTAAYGPYAYGLSGFSENAEVAAQFGGNGVVGLHGTNDPASIGKDDSNGCIRVNNDVITQMKDLLPLGTPVEIVA